MQIPRWTEARIRELAREFSSRTELAKKHSGAYRFARSMPGVLDELFGNQKFVWTERALINEANKYQSKSEFMRNSGGAYGACLNRFPHILDIFDNKIKYWKTEEVVRDEALKYDSRTSFKFGSTGAYKSAVAKFPHLLDEIFGPSKILPYTEQEIVDLAATCSSRKELMDKCASAYAAASRFPGLLDSLFPKKYRYWGNEDDVRTEASKYKTKSEFVFGCVSAYGAALQMGIIDDLGFLPSESGFDTSIPAYFYLTELTLTDGIPAVMFGVTNNPPRFRYKIWEQAFMANRVTHLFDTGRDALTLETHLKRKFKDFWVEPGKSPLQDKSGTSGEILVGPPLRHIEAFIAAHVGDACWGKPW